MKLSIAKGATSVLVRIFIRDSSSGTGQGLTGLAYNTSSLACYRMRDDDGNNGATAVSLATATLGTWTSGGFVQKDSSHGAGWYEFGIPNAALATGSRSVSFLLYGATNMAPCPVEIELTGIDNQDAVRSGMTALPNTACTTNASLLTSGTGTDQISVASGVAKANLINIAGSAVSTSTAQLGVNVVNFGGSAGTFSSGLPSVNDIATIGGHALVQTSGKPWCLDGSGNALATASAVAGIPTAVWQDTTTGDFNIASSIGKSLYTGNHAPGAASGLALVGSQMDLVNAPNATAVTAIQSGLATPTNITAGTITTVTNVTNAPTAGDLTSTMKTSVQVAVAAQAATIASYVRDVSNASPAANSLGAGINTAISGISALGSPLQASSVPANFSTMAIDTNGRVSIKSGITINNAINGFTFPMYNSSGVLTTGLTVTAQRSINGGAFANCTNSPSEVGSGVYSINLSAADLNGATVALRFSATGAVDTNLTIDTTP